MSDPRFSIIPADAVLDKRLEPRDLQVLCIFGKHTDKRGWCRRSQVVMAKEIGCARSTVQASIDRLIAAGWLQKRPQNELHTTGVRDSAHEYRVVLDVPDAPQDVVSTLPTDRHPLPTHVSAPPADIEIGTYVNEPLSTNPSLTKAIERVSLDVVWDIYPRRLMTDRREAEAAWALLTDEETVRCLISAKRTAQWHIEDCADRGTDVEAQKEYRTGLGKWIRSGAWVKALSLPLRFDPTAATSDDLVVLVAGDDDFRAVAKLRGRAPVVGSSGKVTVTRAELQQARQVAA